MTLRIKDTSTREIIQVYDAREGGRGSRERIRNVK